jgi:DNA-binding response OmpR family regulator
MMPDLGRILIVDDSELLLGEAASALQAAGYDVVTTSQAVGASRLLTGCDLAIIDFHMPGFDGRDLVASMRNAIRTSQRRGYRLYLYSTDELATAQYRSLGFDGCLTDKGDGRALVEQVHAVFRLIRMHGVAERVRRALG